MGNSELGCVVAMKVLEISTRKETVDNINKNTKLLTERVNALIDKYDGFITGYTQRGVIMGINFDCEDASKTVCKGHYLITAYGHTIQDSTLIHCS